MTDLAVLGLEIDSRPAVQAASDLDKLTVSAERSERATDAIRAASGELVAALRENTTATGALTARMNEMRASAMQTQGAVQGAATAAASATSNVVQLATAHRGASAGLDAAAASARASGTAWKGMADQAVEALRRIEAARRTATAAPISTVPPISLAPPVSAVPRQVPVPTLPPVGYGPVQPWGAPAPVGPTGPRVPQGGADGVAPGGRLAPWQVQQLMAQGIDVGVSLQGGMNPLTVLMQQGGQIAPLFAGEGGASVKGALKQAGEGAAALASRIGLVGGAIGGLGATVVAGAVAWNSYNSAQKEAELRLQGVGRASGVTLGMLNSIAAENAGAGRISVSDATSFGATFAASGRIGPEVIAGLITTTKDYARVTGQDGPEAAKALAAAFAEPAKGADTLSARLGFLNETTRETIQRLEAQGDRLGAQRVMLDAYKASLNGVAETQAGWSRMLDAAGTGIGNVWGKIGRNIDKALFGGSPEQELIKAQQRLEAARAVQMNPIGEAFGFGGSVDVEREARAVERWTKVVEGAKKATEEAQRNMRSLEIGQLVRTLEPEMGQFRTLEDQAILLRKAITDPMHFNLDGRRLADAETGFARISEKVRQMRDDIGKFGSASVAAMNRAAENQRALVGLPAYERSATETNQSYQQKMLERSLPLDTPLPSQVQAEFDRQMRQTPSWNDKIKLDSALEERLRRSREAEGLRSERDTELGRLGAEAAVAAERRRATANDNLSAVQLPPYQRRVAELEVRQREIAEADRSSGRASTVNRQTFAAERAALDYEAINRPLQDSTRQLNEQVGALRLQESAFGASTAQAAALAEKVRLTSEYTRQGIDVQGTLRERIDEIATAYGRVAERAEEVGRRQREIVGGLDDIRYGARSMSTGIFADVMRGKDPSANITNRMQDMAIGLFDRQISGPATEMLAGQMGKAGGGLFGDTIASFFGGDKALQKADITAGVVNLSGAISMAGLGGLPGISGTSGVKDAGSFVSKVVGGGGSDAVSYAPTIAGKFGRSAGLTLFGDDRANAQAIANIESSGGNYDALGPWIARKGGRMDRGYGAYQVMGDNVGPWTEKYLGRRMEPEEFRKDKGAQDAVFKGEFNSYVRRFGNIEDAASMWHSGRPLARAMGARDPLGTRTPDYVRSFTKDVERYRASALPSPDTATKMLDPALSGAADAAAKATENVKKFQSDLTTLPTPLAQASQGLDQLGNSVGAKGGGLLQALASMFTGSVGAPASVPTATAATGYIPGYASGRIPSYAAGRLDPDPTGSPLSTRARVDTAGVVHGPGTGTSDSILAVMNERSPIRISDREAIIRADAVAYYGPSTIKAINERRLDRERVVERAMPASLAGAQGYALGRVPAYAEGRVPERPRASPIWMPPQPQTTSQPSGPSEVKLSVVNESGYPVRAEAREVPDGRGGRKQALVLIDTVAGAAQSPKVQSALKQSAVVQR